MYYSQSIKYTGQSDFDQRLYMIGLINTQQNRTNNFVNIDEDDLTKLMKSAHTYDMSETEIIEMILDLNYA